MKETNRIDAVVNELKKLGANITATDDGMIIEGPTIFMVEIYLLMEIIVLE